MEEEHYVNDLYEELMWPNEDQLEFIADFENDRIIITRKK